MLSCARAPHCGTNPNNVAAVWPNGYPLGRVPVPRPVRLARRRRDRRGCRIRNLRVDRTGRGRLDGCYMYSSPQCVQVPTPIVANSYCLQDGQRVTCVLQSMHLSVSFACHALRSRFGIFRGFDRSLDPLKMNPVTYFFSSSAERATNPVCRWQPGQTVIARRSMLAM